MNPPTTLLGQQGSAPPSGSGPLLTTPHQTTNVPTNQHTATNTVATNPQLNTNSQTQYSNLTVMFLFDRINFLIFKYFIAYWQ